MRVLIFLGIFFFQNLCAQQVQRVLEKADSLLFDSQAEQTITLLNSTISNKLNVEEKHRIYIKIAEAFILMGKYDKAQEQISLVQKNQLDNDTQAQLRSTEGMLALYQGRNDNAEKKLREAINLFEKTNAIRSLVAAQTFTTLGLVCLNSGKNKEAEEHLLMAFSIRIQQLSDTHPIVAASYNNLGLACSQTNPEKALMYYEKALSLYKILYGSQHPKIAVINTNIGVIYRNIESFGEAINSLETALEVWTILYPQEGSTQKAFVLYTLGGTYLKMGNIDNATDYFRKSLIEYENTHGEKHPDIANVLNALGSLEVSKNNFDNAIEYYNRALQANTKIKNETSLAVLAKTSNYYNSNYFLYSLMFKAQAIEARYFGKTLKLSDLQQALDILMVCDTLIDKIRQQTGNEADKIALGVIADEVYTDGVRIAAYMSEVAFRNKHIFRKQAFYFAEKSKSAVLLEAISDTNAKSFANIPDHLLNQENELKASITTCSQKLAQKPSEEEEKQLRDSLYNLNRNYQNFSETLASQYPEYYNLKFNTTTPSFEALQKVIDAKTALLSYFIDEKNNRIYIFQITSKSVSLITHLLPTTFNKHLTGFRNSIYYGDEKTLETVGEKLYKTLIPKLYKEIKNIVIFPSGRLSAIPFEALLSGSVKTDRPIPYLIQKYAVQYEFSASLALQKSTKKQTTNQSILLCAPVLFPAYKELPDLPGTEEEVRSIASLFSKNNIPTNTLLFAEATKAELKSKTLKNYNIIHLATHGVVDEVQPELSRVFLQTDSTFIDGCLYSGEIYNLQLNASLVTLSACQTGLGKISKGEGVIGLSRALVYAGAKNLIVSYWSVADESTSQIMKKFYTHLLQEEGIGYAEALQKVKIEMLTHPHFSTPYYWAPFVLIGF